MVKVTKEKLDNGEITDVVILFDDQTVQPLVSLECKDEITARNIAELLTKLQRNGDIISILEPLGIDYP